MNAEAAAAAAAACQSHVSPAAHKTSQWRQLACLFGSDINDSISCGVIFSDFLRSLRVHKETVSVQMKEAWTCACVCVCVSVCVCRSVHSPVHGPGDVAVSENQVRTACQSLLLDACDWLLLSLGVNA